MRRDRSTIVQGRSFDFGHRSALFGSIALSLTVLVGVTTSAGPAARAQSKASLALHDIHPTGDSAPRFFSVLGDQVVFSADDGEHGRELWIADGTSDGTRLLRDIRPGPEGSSPVPGDEMTYNPVPLDARTRFTRVGDRLYFVADDGVHGREIWSTDGTRDGTRMLADVTEGDAEWSIAAWLTEHDGQLYFLGDDGENGEELWVSDGSEAGTRMLRDIYEGPAGSLPAHLASTTLGLAFSAESESEGVEPWITDGSSEGTILLGDFVPDFDGSDPDSFIGFEDRIYFAASDAPGGANYEPWVSDGTPAGTRMLKDLNPDGRGFGIGYHHHQGALYFSANDGVNGIEVWRSDGSAEGTRMVGEVAFRGRGSTPSGLASFGELLFFSAFHFSYGIEPWLSDGTAEGTRLLKDVNPGEVASSEPAEATALGDRLYFAAERNGSGRELWSSDGTDSGTELAADIAAGAQGSDPTGLIAHRGLLFFAASDAANGDELRVLGGEAPPTAPPPEPTVTPTPDAPEPSSTPEEPQPSETPEEPRIFLPFCGAGAAEAGGQRDAR